MFLETSLLRPGFARSFSSSLTLYTSADFIILSYKSFGIETQGEVKRFLEAFAGFPKGKGVFVHPQLMQNILMRPIYAGNLDKPDLGFSLQPGKHGPLISFEKRQSIDGASQGPCSKRYSRRFSSATFCFLWMFQKAYDDQLVKRT